MQSNVQKMREALLRCKAISHLPEIREQQCVKDMRNIINHALSAPRNCDRHTGWLTALKEFNDTEGRRKPWGGDVYDTRFLDWLFASRAEGVPTLRRRATNERT